MEPFEVPLRPFLVFLVVLARIGGLVTFAPFWSHRAANPRVRIVIAIVLSLALAPAVGPLIETPPSDTGALLIIVAGELIIGAVLGFTGRIVFMAFELASHFLASQMGFSLAGTIDPSTQAQTTAFGTVAQMFALMVLLGAGGHHWFLAATVKSYLTTAPGAVAVNGAVIDNLLRLSADALLVGVTLAAPAVIVLLAVEFALEFFGRTAPQFQVFILGFPLKIAVGLWILGATLYFLPNAARDVLSRIHDGLLQMLNALA